MLSSTLVSEQTEARALRQQETLRQVIESISSELQLAPLLTRIVRYACELLGADRGTIGLVDDARQVIRTEAAYHMPPDELGAEMAPGVGLAGTVWLKQEPVVLNRYGDLEHPTQYDLAEDSVVGVPILWRDQMIGFFGIGAVPPRQFSAQDVQTLALFARHAAIAIENARLFEAGQRTLQEIQLLYATSLRIGAAMDMDGVVEAYLEQVATRGRYTCTVVLYQFNAAGERTAVIVCGRWSQQEGLVLGSERIPYTRDALDPLLDAGQTVTISNVHTDPRVSAELQRIQTQSQRPALAFIPLIVRGQRIGLVILSYPTVYEWSAPDLQPYQATAAQLAMAIDSRRQQQLARERSREVAVLEERQRLARELHDSVTQTIFSMTLVAQSIAPAWSRQPEQGEQRVRRLLDLSQKALAEMRTLLTELRPLDSAPPAEPPAAAGLAQVARDGLVPALKAHLVDVAQDGLELELNAEGYVGQPFDREAALFRITQEALNNIVKHAHARRAVVRLSTDANAVCLTVADDGVGLEAGTGTGHGGLGLKSMRERAEGVGGILRISPTSGGGTTVEVTLPLRT